MKKMYITGSLKNSLSNVIENLCNTLSSPSAVYRVQDTEVVFNSSSLVGLPNEAVCSRLLDLTTSDEDEFVSGKQKHSKSYKQVRVAQVVTFILYLISIEQKQNQSGQQKTTHPLNDLVMNENNLKGISLH